MKKVLVILSLLVFVGVYAAPALTMSQDVAAKIVTVDKDKKDKKAKKAEKSEAKASCCEAKKVEAKSSCCSASKGEAKGGCAATCKEAAACKGQAAKAGEKK